MATYNFDKFNDLICLLFEAKDTSDNYVGAFDNWEVTYLSVSAPLGLGLNINTKSIDTGGEAEYKEWKKVKNIVKTFLTQDMSNEFTNVQWYDRIPYILSQMDVRLKCPKSLKDTLDPNGEFDSFRLTLTIDYGLIIATATAVERTFPASADIILAWNNYIADIIRKWKIDEGK